MRSWSRVPQPLGWFLVLLIVPLIAADEPNVADKKPSQYAPIQDVVAQVEMFLKQLGEDLSAEADYGDDQKTRVVKDANTLIVLAQVLGNHDQDHEKKGAAAGLFAASEKLANSTGSYAKAKPAFDAVTAAWQATAPAEVTWDPTASLQELMAEVPILNNRLRSGVTGRRFDRTIEQNAGLATTLAAIAQASLRDTDYCDDEADQARWAKICADMRDACADVAVSVRKKDQKAATAALERVVKTCDDCHHEFRDE